MMWRHLTNDITITSENDKCSFTASQTEQNTYTKGAQESYTKYTLSTF